MFCSKCGSKIKKGTKFCTHCGAPIPQDPNGGADGAQAGKAVSETSPGKVADKEQAQGAAGNGQGAVPGPGQTQKPKRLDRKIALVGAIAAAVAALAIVGVIALTPGGAQSSGSQSVPDETATDQGQSEQGPAEQPPADNMDSGPAVIDDDEPVVIEPIAPEEAFEHAEVVSSVNAADSPDVMSESKAAKLLEKRGFSDIALTTEYGADGTYTGEQEVDGASSANHPIYEATYIASDGSVWALLLYNGQLMANPLSYNSESNDGATVILSETKEVTSYDSATNTFYRIIPDGTELEVKTVDRIDAEKLDDLGHWGVEGL